MYQLLGQLRDVCHWREHGLVWLQLEGVALCGGDGVTRGVHDEPLLVVVGDDAREVVPGALVCLEPVVCEQRCDGDVAVAVDGQLLLRCAMAQQVRESLGNLYVAFAAGLFTTCLFTLH